MKTSERNQHLDTIPVFRYTDIDIPHTLFTLSNGLRLIVHEDHKAPIVAVNVWYHVGSKNERAGKSGLAHLFEHLMFNGSENFNDDYFQALMAIGATDVNGTTSYDRTNYFQNVPVAALDRVLWLESDRMGHLLGALDQSKLDEQRGVVQNEKRQRENVPYGIEHELITKEMYPPGHPYSWPVIGSMEDLDGTTVEDCHKWFRDYYGAANAVLVVAGDVEPTDVFERVKRYFGDIEPGPAILRPELNIPQRNHETRMSYQDRVPESRIVMTWNTAQLGSPDDAYLDLAASVLSGGKNARLYKSLVYEKRIASSAAASQWSREIAGNFFIAANAKPGQSVQNLEKEIIQILSDFIEEGPTPEELDRIRARYFSGFIKGLERIGGFGGKSDVLASSTVHGGSPDAYQDYNRMIAEATPEDVQNACQRWLTKGKFTLTCHPLPELEAAAGSAEIRKQMPDLAQVQAGAFPAVERTTLENGLEVVLARRTGSPAVVVQAHVRTGFAHDGSLPGLAKLSMSLLDEGTAQMNALEINERLQLLGASLSISAGLDFSEVRLHTLRQSLKQSLDLFSDVLLNPAFPEDQLERLRSEQQDAIQREKATPMSMALRVVPPVLFGKGHRYAQPLTGSGTASALMQITRDDIVAFYRERITPGNCVLTVTGDLSMRDLMQALQGKLDGWMSSAVPEDIAPIPSDSPRGMLYFLDRPGSLQSIVIGACLVESFDPDITLATDLFNDVLGGQFTSRINMNLREDKHWTYGARSLIVHTMQERPFLVYVSVQMDKTLETIREICKEVALITGDQPVTEEEFQKNKSNTVMGLPGQWETNAAVAESVGSLIKLGLPDDYFQRYPDLVRKLTLDEVQTIARKLVLPEALSWFVVGDGAQVLPQLSQWDPEKIIRIDIEGNKLK